MHASTPPLLVRKLENFPETNDLPSYATEGAAGMDVQSAETALIPPGGSAVLRSGLSFAIPEGYEIQVRSRSGLAAKHAVFVTNGPGTIDADYRGELGVILTNCGTEDFRVMVGHRIAQLVIAPTYRPSLIKLVEELPDTVRGHGGFGSTGR